MQVSKHLLLAIFVLLFTTCISAQTTTILLLRHAEKDTTSSSATMMVANPSLSKAGELRSQQLLTTLQLYKPDIIYSTNYIRTKATVEPLSKKFNKEIQWYDPKKLQSFADSLLQIVDKTIVVVGHSNTTPALVNLLIRENKYPAMEDNNYNQFWIVTIQNNKAVAELRNY